jgi:hypothetical protein
MESAAENEGKLSTQRRLGYERQRRGVDAHTGILSISSTVYQASVVGIGTQGSSGTAGARLYYLTRRYDGADLGVVRGAMAEFHPVS